ncbi:TIGR01244 family sulfur transferase [Paenirhodobacter enshiensis]|uniref:Beta-lactamase hydrolase-like protein phosphatase-like domain-containing protein n=1 Tax=Paenirhodobacter enshiensis TaxID=1105367 RepID=A0A086XYW6_9RHOB|nr:TIGR01244 family sulfur transferase [Paenirhodobacter enshiensis]KFI27216.1 hypothetical protein CG50_00255 [Paenirhodobacter enshiensis]
MDIRQITPELSVAPQIEPEEVAQLAALGFRALIDNRPDAEAGPERDSAAMAEAAKAAGLAFRYIPYEPGLLTDDLADAFGAALSELDGPVLAYCRSGTRSSHLWAMTEAGRRPIDEIVQMAAHAGYDHSGLLPALQARAAQRRQA